MSKSKKLNWCVIYRKDPLDSWTLPFGFANEMEKQNLNIKRVEFKNAIDMKLPDENFLIKYKIKIILIFHSGFNINLNNSLIDFKKKFPNIFIINELGDEPQTQKCNFIRAALSDVSLTPDYESYLYWRNKGFNCYWFNHWADESIFINKNYKRRNILIGTTMGNRKYSLMLKTIFLKKFKNENKNGKENTDFYNSTSIVFQYARWGEITRRIFEAASSGCCVVTNKLSENKNLEKIFNHNESIIFYRNRIELILELFKLIFNKKKRTRIAYNAEFIVRNYHTAKVRVAELLSLVDKNIAAKSKEI